MFILAIETAGPRAGVAVVKSGLVKSKVEFKSQGKLGAQLTPAVDKCLKDAGLSHDNPPDLIAVDIGPGSYTGIRVGLAGAKSLGFAWRKPLIGICSLDALVVQAPEKAQRVVTAIDARKGDVYAAAFERHGEGWRSIIEASIYTPAELLKLVPSETTYVVGNAAQLLTSLAPKSLDLHAVGSDKDWPKAESVAELGWQHYQRGRLDDILSLNPVYMRPTAPEIKAGRKRRRTQKHKARG